MCHGENTDLRYFKVCQITRKNLCSWLTDLPGLWLRDANPPSSWLWFSTGRCPLLRKSWWEGFQGWLGHPLPFGRIRGTWTLHFPRQVSDHCLTCPTPPSTSPLPHCAAKNRIWETHPWLSMGLHGEWTPLLMCQVRTMELYCICRARYKSQIPWFLEDNLCPAPSNFLWKPSPSPLSQTWACPYAHD